MCGIRQFAIVFESVVIDTNFDDWDGLASKLGIELSHQSSCSLVGVAGVAGPLVSLVVDVGDSDVRL